MIYLLIFFMLGCLGIFSYKVLNNSRDVVINGFNVRLMFVSHVNKSILNVFIHGLKMVKVRFR